MGRKVRAGAKLEQLNAAPHECLRTWFEEEIAGIPRYSGLVRQEFGLSVGKNAVGVYWRRHVLPERQQDDAELTAALPAQPTGDFDAAILQQARALAWTALVRPIPDIERVAKLLARVRKAERCVALREALAAQPRASAGRRSEPPRESLLATLASCEASESPSISGLFRAAPA